MGVGNALNINQAGLQSFDGISVFTGRTITAGSGISIANGNGISGNPIVSSSLSFPLDPSLGGTGANNSATSGTLLRGNGTDFVPTTATYPNTAGTSGNVLTSDGTNWTSAAAAGGSSTYFQAYRTSNQTVAGGSTSDTIVFDTAISNVGSAYATGTGIFTAPATGYYAFSCTVNYVNLNVPVGLTEILLAYTGSVQSLRLIDQGIGGAKGGTGIILTASWSMPMTSGDTVKIQPYCDGAGNYIIYGTALTSGAFNTASTFSGFRVA